MDNGNGVVGMLSELQKVIGFVIKLIEAGEHGSAIDVLHRLHEASEPIIHEGMGGNEKH